MDAELINSIIEQSDSYILQHGGKEGYKKYKLDVAQSIQKNVDLESEKSFDEWIFSHIEWIEKGDPASPHYSKVLLALYVDFEQRSKTPQFLKEWVLNRLNRISKGESANSAFHLNPPVGVTHTKRHNRFRCVCFVMLKLREGMKKSEAITACAEEFKMGERVVYTFLEGIIIGEHISTNTLIFYRDNDISNDYTPTVLR